MKKYGRFSFIIFTLLLVLVMFFDVTEAKKKDKSFRATVTEYTLKLNPSKKEKKFKIFRPYNSSWSNDYYVNIYDFSKFLSEIDLDFDIDYDKKAKKLYLRSYLPYKKNKYSDEKGLKKNTKVKVKKYKIKLYVNDSKIETDILEYSGKPYVDIDVISKKIGIDWKINKATMTISSNIPEQAFFIKGVGNESDIYSTAGPRWGSPIYHYTYYKGNRLTSLEVSDKKLWVREYSKKYKLLNEMEVEKEGMFGNFLKGENYNFILFGNNNKEESNTKTVFRVVKYDQEFNRIGSCDISNCFTVMPFDAGVPDMDEKEGVLIVHTSRERYLTEDGLNHQSQMTFIINSDTMTLMNEEDIDRFQENHVSHSFHQQVCIDYDKKAYLLDHGDAYPRALVLRKTSIENEGLGYNTFSGEKVREEARRLSDWLEDYDEDETIPQEEYDRIANEYKALEDIFVSENENKKFEKEEVDLLQFPGNIGDNQTGLSVGNMVQGDRNLLIAVNHIDYSKANYFDDYDIKGRDTNNRDIFVFIVDKANILSCRKIRITDYNKVKGKPIYSVPRIVKMENDNYLVLWNMITKKGKKDLCYLRIDQDGNLLSDMKRLENIVLGNTNPIYKDGKVFWTMTDYDKSLLYEIEIE